MNENNENIIKLDIKSFVDMCQKIETLEKENNELKEENTYFKARNLSLATRCRDLVNENRELHLQLKDVEFTNKVFCNATPSDIAEQEFLVNGENNYYEMGTAIYGDDF